METVMKPGNNYTGYNEHMANGGGDKKNISRHILPAAANLMGLCFVIFSMLKAYQFAERTLLDELTAGTMLLFLASSLFSYGSIRAKNGGERCEKIADLFFLAGLTCMTLISVFFVLDIIK
ncbi:MAG: hypothetical protein FIA94_06530 [Nitrospirae bacterium]|nr:hypothetical protein [Nitrospirota bacterium]